METKSRLPTPPVVKEQIKTPGRKKFDYTKVDALINKLCEKYPQLKRVEDNEIDTRLKQILFNIIEDKREMEFEDFDVDEGLSYIYNEIVNSERYKQEDTAYQRTEAELRKSWSELLPILEKVKKEKGDEWQEVVLVYMINFLGAGDFQDALTEIKPLEELKNEPESVKDFVDKLYPIKQKLSARFSNFGDLFTEFIRDKIKY